MIEIALLIVIVILVIYFTRPTSTTATAPVVQPVAPQTMMVSTPTASVAPQSPEDMAQMATLEAGGEENSVDLAAGSFHEYIKQLSIDPQVQRNHNEFVKDRLDINQQNFTGRTYALGTIEDDSGVVWQGIRGRPQQIPDKFMGNPTQVSDIRQSAFAKGPRFVWTST